MTKYERGEAYFGVIIRLFNTLLRRVCSIALLSWSSVLHPPSSDAVQIGLRILNSSLFFFGCWLLAIGCSIWIRSIYPVPWNEMLLMKVCSWDGGGVE